MPDHGVAHEIDVNHEVREDVGYKSGFSPAPSKPKLDLPATVGANLRRFRVRGGLSLERLASLSGVSRGMIGRIEMGRSTPTVGLLSRLADALGVQLVSLITTGAAAGASVLRHGRSPTIEASDGKFVVRPLSKRHVHGVEFSEIAIAYGHSEEGERRTPGSVAHVVVASGTVDVTVAGEPPVTLSVRDAIVFPADAPHAFRNAGDREAILYVTVSPGALAA